MFMYFCQVEMAQELEQRQHISRPQNGSVVYGEESNGTYLFAERVSCLTHIDTAFTEYNLYLLVNPDS